MQIVIDIDDDLYTRLFDIGENYVKDMLDACIAIRKGILLPKGHGRLIDVDTIPICRLRGITEYCKGYNNRSTEVENDMENAPTIIEADKENENADSD